MTTGTARAARWLEDGQLKLRDTPMIFMYHGVADVDEDPNQLCVSPARFAGQMAWLARRGLRGVGLLPGVGGRVRGLAGVLLRLGGRRRRCAARGGAGYCSAGCC